MSIKITLPDGTVKEKQPGVTAYDIAAEIGPGLAKAALAAEVDGEPVDLHKPIEHDASLRLLTFKDDEGKEVFWHTSTHLIAQAVKRLFPEAQLTIGPVVNSGPGFFYYDIDYERNFTQEDLENIEAEVQKIIKEDLKISRRELPREESIKLYKDRGENYKAELIADFPGDEPVSMYNQGEFEDLCRGPHLPSTGKVGAIKVTSLAGAYWRGDQNNRMLQRIYGISFPSKKELKSYLEILEETKKRDHRKLGSQLGLFSFQEEGQGFPFWHGRGTTLFNTLQDYVREMMHPLGYQEVRGPQLLNESLWRVSGHWDHFKDNMYFTEIDEVRYAIKPMNCPGHNLIYKSERRSYRELPLKLAEFGCCHRYEASGALHGLFRVRSFTQDDAHIFCEENQLKDEVMQLIGQVHEAYNTFGFKEIATYIATRPEESTGTDEMWETATSALIEAVETAGIEYKIKEGEGAFYGPKIEFNIKDCLGRYWQCGTIQVDYSMPERFELSYTGSDGNEHRPVMIHRAILGSLERFIGILIEEYAGKFPLWLSPLQVKVLPISDAQNDAAIELQRELRTRGFRVECDLRGEKVGYKIRAASEEKPNYMVILGAKEVETGHLSVRRFGQENTESVSRDDFISRLQAEIKERRLRD